MSKKQAMESAAERQARLGADGAADGRTGRAVADARAAGHALGNVEQPHPSGARTVDERVAGVTVNDLSATGRGPNDQLGVQSAKERAQVGPDGRVVLDVAKGIIPEPAPETPEACVRREAAEMSALIAAGNTVSQSDLIRLVHAAVGLLPAEPHPDPVR